MASFSYNGTNYFYANGKWVDSQSKPVSPEIAAELNQLYSKEDIKIKEDAQKKKQKKADFFGRGKKPSSYSGYGTYYGSSPVTRSSKPGKKHRKARVDAYRRTVELTKDQRRALALLESGQNVFLSGEAGTGKSFVLNEYIYRNRDKDIIVCAPTGIAAINVGGSTLHRVFKAPIGVARPGEYNAKPDEALVKAEIIIIDEISMCRFDLFEYVIRTIRQAELIRQNKENSGSISHGELPELLKPKQIIVVGDFYQLAPVISSADKEVLYQYWDESKLGDGFAFQSELWKELNFQNIILKEIIRQRGDDEYISNLNKIRVGDESGIEWFNANIKMEPIPNSIYLCGTNRAADEINDKEAAALPGDFTIYNADVKGQVGTGDKATADALALKVGMQVMTLVNNIEEGYQNGSIGKIISLSEDSVEVKLNSGRIVTVTPYDWEVLGYEIQQEKLEKIVLGNFKQMPLKVAYAITIHKSQGQTYSSANISPNCFADGQLYVALSRTKTVEGMSLEHPITKKSLRTSKLVQEFYANLEEFTQEFRKLSI